MDDKRKNKNEEELEQDVILETNNESVSESGEHDGQLQSEFETMTILAQQLENQLKRSLADYQNLERRVQEEKSNWIRTANKELLLKLLPVLDTLLLTQKHVEDKGLQLSISSFEKGLEEEGVTRIETKGKEFDPMIMEAVTTQESEKEKGKVLEEIRAGYMYCETILRVAQVIVGA